MKHQANWPSRRQQAQNLANTIKDVARNPRVVSSEIYQRRRGICDACPFISNNRCTKCGCILSAKLKFTAAKCPIGKW